VSRRRRSARWAASVLLTCGVVALGFAAYVIIDARLYQSAERKRFDRTRQDAAAASPATAGTTMPSAVALPVPTDGASIGEIQISRLGLRAIVVQGESAPVLRRGVGHLSDTALPGEVGNVVLAGHRDTFFRPLSGVRAGDSITLKTRDGEFEYQVESTSVVTPNAIQVLEPTGGRTLTLITCYPFSYIGAAPNRFIVHARQQIEARRD
jgi:sortase A